MEFIIDENREQSSLLPDCLDDYIDKEIGEVKCPVRIIEGTDDTIYTVSMAEGTMERLVNCPDKKLVAVEGYGHFIAVESPENVAKVIDELIRGLKE